MFCTHSLPGEVDWFREAKKDDEAVHHMVSHDMKHRKAVLAGEIPANRWPFMECKQQWITMSGTRVIDGGEVTGKRIFLAWVTDIYFLHYITFQLSIVAGVALAFV